jgi:hypothetical protein
MRVPVRADAHAPGDSVPLVAVLCRPSRGRAAAAGVAIALARALDRSCALVTVFGAGPVQALGGTPAARRTAAALPRRGLRGAACGRLVWLADQRVAGAGDDVAAGAAALSAELGQAAAAAGVPAAIAFPLARSAALDRVLAWHDAIVVVPEADAPTAMMERALASLRALGRPAVAMTSPPRFVAALAGAGLHAPSEAVRAIAQLGLAR